jgi:predicted acetyltransferase
MKVSTEIYNKFGYEKITQLVDNIQRGIEVKYLPNGTNAGYM